MKTVVALLFALILSFNARVASTQEVTGPDVLHTSAGDVEFIFIGHASLILRFHGMVIHFDPFGKVGDYRTLPKADLVFITHDHNDHFDLDALGQIEQAGTDVVVPPICSDRVPEGWIMKNGETLTIRGIDVVAVPAYNVVHRMENGQPYHPKNRGNGYVLTFGDKRIYVAGDTENIPEMKELRGIDVAFLPMSVPSTMTPEMVADAAKAFRPKILYPYHYNDTDPTRLTALL